MIKILHRECDSSPMPVGDDTLVQASIDTGFEKEQTEQVDSFSFFCKNIIGKIHITRIWMCEARSKYLNLFLTNCRFIQKIMNNIECQLQYTDSSHCSSIAMQDTCSHYREHCDTNSEF